MAFQKSLKDKQGQYTAPGRRKVNKRLKLDEFTQKTILSSSESLCDLDHGPHRAVPVLEMAVVQVEGRDVNRPLLPKSDIVVPLTDVRRIICILPR